jgi:hypothetical protein
LENLRKKDVEFYIVYLMNEPYKQRIIVFSLKIPSDINLKIYHIPGGAHYDEVADHNVVWFCTEDEAQAAGYRKSKD